jgi:hypothetical protein
MKSIRQTDKAMTPEQTLTKLLDLCAQHGYDAVAIGMRHEVVPHSMGYTFPESGIFAKPQGRRKCEIDGWPAIWTLTEAVGLESSCGNTHQRFVKDIPFHPQVWQLKKGKWAKIAEEA